MLHGLIKFGKDHPLAKIRVEVEALQLDRIASLDGFVSFGLGIREAIRGIRRPAWAKGSLARIKNWRRGKPPGALDAPNVVFCPRRPFSLEEEEVFNLQKISELARHKRKMAQTLRSHLGQKGVLRDLLGEGAAESKEHLEGLRSMTGAEALIELIKTWFTKGI